MVVGREAALGSLVGRLDGASGSATVLWGEAGVGKSRLVRELAAAARSRDIPVLTGRAVAGRAPEPYRPLAEALTAACRRSGPPQARELVPYRPALGRLIAEWHRPELAGRPESAVVLGEGVLRMLHVLADGAALLLIVEDLHWADPESLAVLEYLADHAAEERVVCVLTGRPDRGPWRDLGRALTARRAASLVELGSLSPAEVAEMARRCLGAEELPAGLDGLLDRAEGMPFLIEELLASAIDAGALIRAEAGWCFRVEGAAVVPPTYAQTVAERMAVLDVNDRDLLAAAALLGLRVDVALLGAVVGQATVDVLAALTRCAAAQLLVGDAGGHRFRHALTSDAVLAATRPETRTALARRARSAMERLHAGLPGQWCRRAAELALAAGHAEDAARLLLTAGRRAIAAGALISAAIVLAQAADLVADTELAVDVDEVRIEAAALAGDVATAFRIGTGVLDRLTDGGRRRLHLRLAEAAATATDWGRAAEQLDRARTLRPDEAELARIDALTAHVHLGEARTVEAESAARRALVTAERLDLAEPACRALEVLGRITRYRDLDAAEASFTRQLKIADAHGLTLWTVRATHELGAVDLMRANRTDRLHRARELSEQAGALATVATLDLQLAASGWLSLDATVCLLSARRCQRAARRGGFGLLLAEALLFEAAAHALGGHRSAMEHAIAEALALGRPEPELRAAAHARRGMFALLREDRTRALAEHEAAVAMARGGPQVYPRVYWHHWALLRTVDGDGDGDASRAELRDLVPPGSPLLDAILGYGDAVAAGRRGHREEAAAHFAAARAQLAAPGLAAQRHLAERLVAECALADGWGQPVAWLADSAAFFRERGHEHVERACRSLLRRAGVPVGRGTVAPALAALGITDREAEVLTLVAAGFTSRDIAARLFISVRTVDKHVERLLEKTGCARRAELARYVATTAAST